MAISTAQVIPTQPKTAASRDVTTALYTDLLARPMGTMRGETFGMPVNYIPPPARIYVVNHSRTRPWRKLMVAVSTRRGADKLLARNKQLREIYNADAIYREVAEGRDMSEYQDGMHPTNATVRIPGGPNGNGGSIPSSPRVIPASENDTDAPIRIEVPEGTWDLYLGNYDRMHGFESAARFDQRGNEILPDAKVIEGEKIRLSNYWKYRHNPVFAYTDDGETVDLQNPFGFLEFIRETRVALERPIDQAYLTAMDLVES